MNHGENLRKALEEFKDNSKYYIEVVAKMAKINRAFYDSYRSVGFSEEESLELIKNHGWKWPS